MKAGVPPGAWSLERMGAAAFHRAVRAVRAVRAAGPAGAAAAEAPHLAVHTTAVTVVACTSEEVVVAAGLTVRSGVAEEKVAAERAAARRLPPVPRPVVRAVVRVAAATHRRSCRVGPGAEAEGSRSSDFSPAHEDRSGYRPRVAHGPTKGVGVTVQTVGNYIRWGATPAKKTEGSIAAELG
jgi:hypothetical protein